MTRKKTPAPAPKPAPAPAPNLDPAPAPENAMAAPVGPGKTGLDAALAEVEGGDTGPEGGDDAAPRRKRRTREQIEADEKAAAAASYGRLASMLVGIVQGPLKAYAEHVDPLLPRVGFPAGTTFALSEPEQAIARETVQAALTMIPPDLVSRWGPLVTVLAGVAVLAVPRYVMLARIRALKDKPAAPAPAPAPAP